MIVAGDEERYNLVTQPNHAALSSVLATHWGNDRFEALTPFAGMVLATAEHDNGWGAYDAVPHLDDDGAPELHRGISRRDWIDFYARGIENVVEIDPYAGLMVSLHATGIRRQRYGTHDEIPPLENRPGYVSFVAHQELLQEQLLERLAQDSKYGEHVTSRDRECLDELHDTGGFDGSCLTWHNYLLLELFDRLSLHLCINSVEMVEGSFGPIRTGAGDDDTIDLELSPEGPSRVQVSPFPFDTEPLTVSVMARTVRGRHEDEHALREAFFRAAIQPLEFTIVG